MHVVPLKEIKKVMVSLWGRGEWWHMRYCWRKWTNISYRTLEKPLEWGNCSQLYTLSDWFSLAICVGSLFINFSDQLLIIGQPRDKDLPPAVLPALVLESRVTSKPPQQHFHRQFFFKSAFRCFHVSNIVGLLIFFTFLKQGKKKCVEADIALEIVGAQTEMVCMAHLSAWGGKALNVKLSQDSASSAAVWIALRCIASSVKMFFQHKATSWCMHHWATCLSGGMLWYNM